MSLLFAATSAVSANSAGVSERACNAEMIPDVRSVWFALNTYVVDNERRANSVQSFSYADMGHLVYDIGQVVHVFDGMKCNEVIKFLLELKSYRMVDGAIGEEISSMLRRNPGKTSDAAKSMLDETISPCLRFYEASRSDLAKDPSLYCLSNVAWKKLLREYIAEAGEENKN